MTVERSGLGAAWFIDAGYLYKAWQSLQRRDHLDYSKLRQLLEGTYLDREAGAVIEDAYFFTAELDGARSSAFHSALAFPPPTGPGLRVKSYWLSKKQLHWPGSMGGGPVVHPETGEPFELMQQKAVDVGLVFHLLRSFAVRRWRTLFLAAGDSDFHEVIQHLVENEGVNVYLIGNLNSISDELRPYAQAIIRLDESADLLARHAPPRTP
jgi:uncharacterized LabA/DUF88 family protein